MYERIKALQAEGIPALTSEWFLDTLAEMLGYCGKEFGELGMVPRSRVPGELGELNWESWAKNPRFVTISFDFLRSWLDNAFATSAGGVSVANAINRDRALAGLVLALRVDKDFNGVNRMPPKKVLSRIKLAKAISELDRHDLAKALGVEYVNMRAMF